MREYSYQVTERSVEALRLLRAPWAAVIRGTGVVTVHTAAGERVRITVERVEVEGGLEAARIRADLVPEGAEPGLDEVPVGDLGLGRNDVVLFNGESWLEPVAGGSGDGRGAGQTVQFSGRAGQRSPTATVLCTTTDALVAAAGTGEGMLIRIGVRPGSLDVVTDRVEIARFLVHRGYTGG